MKTIVALVALVALALVWRSGEEVVAAPDMQSVEHDVAVTSIETYGPAAVNISDTNGRYLWVMAYFANHSDHAEMVNISLAIPEGVPNGCERETQLVLPGQPSQVIPAGGTKYMIWRVRYECHAPATFAVVRQTLTVGLTHCDPSTSLPGPVTSPTPGGVCPRNSQPAGVEADVSNNVMTKDMGVLVR